MLRTVRDACTPHPQALDWVHANQIEDLGKLIAAAAEPAQADTFFASNHVTAGMRTLFQMGIARLAGKSDQALFELAQAMGGGKTHTMVAFGLLATHDDLRKRLFPELSGSSGFSNAKLVAFNGRTHPKHGLSLEIARQLGKPEVFAHLTQHGLAAADEPAWTQLIGEAPTLILLDELPPYFDYAITQPVGGGTLAQVETAALSNLFAAALKLPRLCIVVSNLSGSYEGASQSLHKAIKNVEQEAKRQAKPITPVELGGDEIYQILKKRLFAKLPSDSDIETVVQAFAKATKEAEKAKTIAKSVEQIADEIRRSYPFHPALKDVIALFRNNESWRQTRGLFTFVSKLLRSVWNRTANDVHVVGLQHLDLRDPEVREYVNSISDLGNAIATDIGVGTGSAHVEALDAELESDAASQVASLLLSASLSKSVDGTKGLTRQQLLEILIAPNRDPLDYAQAFERLKSACWYLHRDEQRDAYYFSNAENLTKRLDDEAKLAPKNKIDGEMRRRLELLFKPKERTAYQKVYALPQVSDIDLGGDRVLLILSPDAKSPPADAKAFWDGVVEKNNVCILTGDGSDLASLEQKTRRLYAIAKLRDELPPSHPHQSELQNQAERAELDFHATIQASFNRVWYPSKDGLVYVKLGLTFQSNHLDGELQIRDTLVNDARKVVPDLDKDPAPLFLRIEDMLWPQGQKRVPWNDIRKRALTQQRWLWIRPNGLDHLKKLATDQDRWRYTEDGYIERGPFAKPKTSVIVHLVHRDDATGEAILEVSATHAGKHPKVYVSADKAVPTGKTGTQVTDKYKSQAVRLWFIAVDPTGEHETGEPVTWTNELTIRHQPKEGLGGKREVDLQVVPSHPALAIRYTTNGASPSDGTVYAGPFEVGPEALLIRCRAEADGVVAERDFQLPKAGSDELQVDKAKPAVLKKKTETDGTKQTFDLIAWAKLRSAKLVGVKVEIGAGTKAASVRFPSELRVQPEHLEEVIKSIRTSLGEDAAEARLVIQAIDVALGHDLDHVVKLLGITLTSNDIAQGGLV